MFLKIWTVPLVIFVVASVECLYPYELYAEGSCAYLQAQSMSNVNLSEVGEITYVAGGSRYHLLRHLSSHPLYDQITEDGLIRGACPRINFTRTTGTWRGFGSRLTTFDLELRSQGSRGLFVEATPKNNFPRWDVLQETVSLTDKRNFAFVLSCWAGSDQAAWSVLSRTRSLDEHTKKVVLEHAKQYGFSEENAVFLDSDNCVKKQKRGKVRNHTSNKRRKVLLDPLKTVLKRPNIGIGELDGRRIGERDLISKNLASTFLRAEGRLSKDSSLKRKAGKYSKLSGEKTQLNSNPSETLNSRQDPSVKQVDNREGPGWSHKIV